MERVGDCPAGEDVNIKLIAPHKQHEDSSNFRLLRINLPLLAALTPPGHTITIVDELFSPDDHNQEVDLVGITVITDLAPRAYQIADAYRRMGVKVVMGGIHPTILPDEALQHADAVVVGEAENLWPQVVADAASGRLQRLYRADKKPELAGLPTARRDLFPWPKHRWSIHIGIEASRGCPYDCEFCCSALTSGQHYRVRPPREVIAEIESLDASQFFFVDDALGLNREAGKKLFTDMIPLKRQWMGQGTVSLAEDVELLKLMRRSGCQGLLLGFESVQKAPQHGIKKIKNLKIDFYEAMRRFHGEGISILGAFVFGFDYENKDVFEQTFEFIVKGRLDCVQLRILTPLPGTRLYARLYREGRLFEPDWWLRGYPPDTLLFKPKSMTAGELLSGYARLIRQTYSFGAMLKRFFGISPWERTLRGCLVYAGVNLSTRHRYFKGLRTPQPFLGAAKGRGEP
jgi:radical SAM superfamily enzyme YgiQ (UPF0313 family)